MKMRCVHIIKGKNSNRKLYSKHIAKHLITFSRQFTDLMNYKNYLAAAQVCLSALTLVPKHHGIRSDLALSLLRSGKYADAEMQYHILLDHENELTTEQLTNVLDGITEVKGWLKKNVEVKKFGLKVLELRDSRYQHGVVWSLDTVLHSSISPLSPQENIISYSLYGTEPKYCETMIENARLSLELFPDWRVRVYFDRSVPLHVIERLKRLNVQLYDMSSSSLFPTFWRFLVLGDSAVNRFLCRDADALLSLRDQAVVKEWVDSGMIFHHIRDYFTHTALVLAGLWGGHGGIVPDIAYVIQKFLKTYKGKTHFADQAFLEEIIWPTMRKCIMCHDDIFKFYHSFPFPQHEDIAYFPEKYHLGSNVSWQSISGNLAGIAECEGVLYFSWKNQNFVYPVNIQNGKWSVAIPFFMIEDFQNENLKIEFRIS